MPFKPRSIVVHEPFVARYAALEGAAAEGRRPEASIWKGLQTAISRLRLDATWGDVIPNARIPPRFTRGYGALNLYCIDLAAFHRGFYTIVGRAVVLLDIVDHTQYDKWFPNKGR